MDHVDLRAGPQPHSNRWRALGLTLAAALSLSACTVDAAPHTDTEPVPAHEGLQPDYPAFSNIDEILDRATTALTGTVISAEVRKMDLAIASESDDPRLNPQAGPTAIPVLHTQDTMTVYTIEVRDPIKGQPGHTLEVKVPVDTTEAPLDLATEVLLFLEEYPNGTPASPLNNYQGILVIDSASQTVMPLDGTDLAADFLQDAQALVFNR